jgi:hypothetical protein
LGFYNWERLKEKEGRKRIKSKEKKRMRQWWTGELPAHKLERGTSRTGDITASSSPREDQTPNGSGLDQANMAEKSPLRFMAGWSVGSVRWSVGSVGGV